MQCYKALKGWKIWLINSYRSIVGTRKKLLQTRSVCVLIWDTNPRRERMVVTKEVIWRRAKGY
ncbi:hypothetical protein CsSME_00002739 [Camellia sinensis var. sinensis]